MQKEQYLLLMGIAAAFLLIKLCVALVKRKKRRQRDFTRRLETLLQPDEDISVVCPSPQGRWILTNKRLIMEAGEAFTAFPFKKIKKVSGVDETGKGTVAAAKMAVLTVKTAGQEFTLRRKGEDFTDFVKGLRTGVNRAKPKKKTAAPKEKGQTKRKNNN